MAPTARKKPCASDSRPVVPTSRFSPMAPTIAPNTANPVRSQNSSTYRGSASITTRTTTSSSGRSRARRGGDAAARSPLRVAPRVAVVSDTGQLLGAEESGRPDQEDGDHDDVGDDVAEAAPQVESRPPRIAAGKARSATV